MILKPNIEFISDIGAIFTVRLKFLCKGIDDIDHLIWESIKSLGIDMLRDFIISPRQ